MKKKRDTGSHMKKLVCILLCMLLALACTVCGVSALPEGEERSVPILGFDAPFAQFSLDTENQLEGAGCVTLTLSPGGGNLFVCALPFEKAVDISSCDSLEFDLYLSDPAFFEIQFPDSQFEISSSGTCDVNELCFLPSEIAAGIEGGPKEGWNHVVLPFKTGHTAGAGPDYRAINFFRFYAVNIPLPSNKITIRLDNLRATDAYAGIALRLRDLCAPLEAQIGAVRLNGIDADNYEEAKKIVTDLKTSFGELSGEAQSVFDDGAYLRLGELVSMLLTYEAGLQTQTEPSGSEASDAPTGTAAQSAPPETVPGEPVKKGCGSSVPCGALLLLLLPAAARKKR